MIKYEICCRLYSRFSHRRRSNYGCQSAKYAKNPQKMQIRKARHKERDVKIRNRKNSTAFTAGYSMGLELRQNDFKIVLPQLLFVCDT